MHARDESSGETEGVTKMHSQRTMLAATVSKLRWHNYFPTSALLHRQQRIAKPLHGSC